MDPSEHPIPLSQQDRFEAKEPGENPPNNLVPRQPEKLDIAAEHEKVKNWVEEISLDKGKNEGQIKDLINQITEVPVSERDHVMQFVKAVSKNKMGLVNDISSIVNKLKEIPTVDRDFIMGMVQRLSVICSDNTHILNVLDLLIKVKEFNKRGLDINASKQMEALCKEHIRSIFQIIEFFDKINLLNFAGRDHLIYLTQEISRGRYGNLHQIIKLVQVIQRIEPTSRDEVIRQVQDAMSGQNSSVEDMRRLIFRTAMKAVEHDDIMFEVPPTNAEVASAAAIKIQHQTRHWQRKQKGKSISKDRKTLFTHMTTVNKVIKKSIIALINNQEKFDVNLSSEIDDIRKLPIEKKIIKVVEKGVGNCGELANLLFILISSDSKISEETKKQLHLCELESPENHAFVVIGDPSDDNSLVIDPWIKYLDLLPVKGYRSQPVSANSVNRERGFFGSKRQYLKFLDAHADGTYVIREQPHQFFITPAPPGDFSEIMKHPNLRPT